KIKKKLEGWKASYLSLGGRLILIKHVLMSIPIYQLMTLHPTAVTIKKIETMLADFFWGITDSKKKYHWKSWKQICLPILEGGLGCKRIKDISSAFGMKLWWHLRKGESLWAQYCRNKTPATSTPSTANSHAWKRLLEIRQHMLPNTIWMLGSG
ncbi:hypothetical protein PSY31_22150, partial [Shigella flexneri]|nr:hypothetical protein [Shigella flexneri]